MTLPTLSLPPPAENQAYVRISALDAGKVKVPLTFILDNAPPGETDLFPVLCFLLRHSSRPDTFLFDLGIHNDWDALSPGWRAEINAGGADMFVPEDAPTALRRGGLDLAALTYACVSHAHVDHIGDPAAFPTTTYLLGAASQSLLSPDAQVLAALPPERTRFLDVAGAPPLGPFPHALDFFGDGSVFTCNQAKAGDDARRPRLILFHLPFALSSISSPSPISAPSSSPSLRPRLSDPPSSSMPARTLPSSSLDPALSPPRFFARQPLHVLSSHPHRDTHDERFLDYNAYALPMPPHNPRPDHDYAAHSSWSPPLRVYPEPSSIPPHWQPHPPNPSQYRDPRPYVSPPPVQPNPRIPWQSINPYTRVLQAQPFSSPPPPPIPHKVWILDCKACGMFLTNRGMKAVLLLRPNVPLYSTDALPINCSAFSPIPEATMRAHSTSVSSTSSSGAGSRSQRSSISGLSDDPMQPGPSTERPPTRTCECLTQTLCCHGCGNAVGYMIVTPCQRCTSSITVNNRATNGHRFVFYSSEITACERHYIPGERGVSPYHPPPPPAPQTLQNSMAGLTIGSSPRQSVVQQPTLGSSSPSTPLSMPPLSPQTTISPRRISVDYLPTPPPDSDSAFIPTPRLGSTLHILPSMSLSPRASVPTSAGHSPSSSQSGSRTGEDPAQILPPAPPNSHSTSPHAGNTPRASSPTSLLLPSSISASASRARAASLSATAATYTLPSHGYGIVPPTVVSTTYLSRPLHPQLVTHVPPPAPLPPPEPLKAGEVLYWHHLLRSGEIPAVSEDPRARLDDDDADAKGGDAELRYAVPSGIVAGR
ncbi:hypothetical protein GSI_03774 [Ganoderma sinense ZZ0214-1]|uniref:Metallo-beta-lactamase domain-containing protein n=1 Tax=Ganoderma sinense ZZ0214-1 TaxID=1077348 RepID=A0A2G8SJX6_9APHY|nr:hypothetical protein GSI_03774 [Ganoderma sinense ZZ0214-1]